MPARPVTETARFALLSLAALSFADCTCRDEPAPVPTQVQSEPDEPSRIQLEVVGAGGETLPSRVHLRNSSGEAVTAGGFPAFDDHFSFPGQSTFELPPDHYAYEVARGPEYEVVRGSVTLGRGETKRLRLQLPRIAELARDGWYSGDLHIHRPPADVPLLLEAEDLNLGGVVTWWNEENVEAAAGRGVVPAGRDRVMDATGGEDERQGGALLYFGLKHPPALPPLLREDGNIVHRFGHELDEYPSPSEIARGVRDVPGLHIALEKPFWWDTPTWVALGLVDSVGIAHNHMNRTAVRNGEAWGRPCEPRFYETTPFGNAYCTQDIYYRLLDAGFPLAPSAGSASGVLPNPVGYNRVYVHLPGGFSAAAWYEALRHGRSFVTNGPILRVTANGHDPGHWFRVEAKKAVDVELSVQVLADEPLHSVELVRDGEVVALGKREAVGGRVGFAALRFERSGWFLVRAIAARTDTFRFASTAPFYIEVGGVPRISAKAVRWFEAWVAERIEKLLAPGPPSEKMTSVLGYHLEAAHRWRARFSRANAD